MIINSLRRAILRILTVLLGPEIINNMLFGRATIKTVKKVSGVSKKLQVQHFKMVSESDGSRTFELPEVNYVVYYGEKDARGHYDIWDPVFAKNPNSYISIVRHAKTWWKLKSQPNVYPISSIKNNETLLARLPNLKAIFYPANNGVNLHGIRHAHIKHVFIGHGDSNKASSANKVFRLYDEVLVAGQAHIDRFSNIPGDYSAIKFIKVGQPWMMDWLNTLPNYMPQERTSWGYFPTWRGFYKDTSVSSLDLAKDIIDAAFDCLGEESTGFIKLHPLSTKKEVSYVSNISEDYLVDEQDYSNLAKYDSSEIGMLEHSDGTLDKEQNIKSRLEVPIAGTKLQSILEKPLQFVICDISAALTECLYINVPIFLYHPGPLLNLGDSFYKQNDFCYFFSDANELRSLLKRVIIDSDDYLLAKRVKALNYYVDLEFTRNGQFYNYLKEL